MVWYLLRNLVLEFYLLSLLRSEKAMASHSSHSSTLAWKIPWTKKPGRLQSMGSWRVGHNWATSLSLFSFMHWRRKWQPTPVFLPGESHGWRSLVGYSPRGCKVSDMTERLHFHFHTLIRSIKLKKSKYECVLNKHLILKCRSKR